MYLIHFKHLSIWSAGTGRDIVVPDFASMAKIELSFVFTAKTSGSAVLGEPKSEGVPIFSRIKPFNYGVFPMISSLSP